MNNNDRNIIVLNLFGIGCRVYKIQLTHPLLEKLIETSKKLNTPLEMAIFDAEFFNKMGDPQYKSIMDLSESIIQGLVENDKSQIEIRVKERKKRMISISELIKQESLLPLYNIEIKVGFENIKMAMVIIEKEIGLVSYFKIETDKLDLDRMRFEVMEIDTGIEKLRILTDLKYNDISLKSSSNDTLVTSNYAILKY